MDGRTKILYRLDLPLWSQDGSRNIWTTCEPKTDWMSIGTFEQVERYLFRSRRSSEMKKKAKHPRIYVSLTAYWGNDDAESTIKVSRRRWKAIREGAEYIASTWSWYEGQRESVTWVFENSCVSIHGDDGMECVLELPVDELITEVSDPHSGQAL